MSHSKHSSYTIVHIVQIAQIRAKGGEGLIKPSETNRSVRVCRQIKQRRS